MQRWLGVVAAVAFLAVGCGDDGGEGAAPAIDPPDAELCAILAEEEPSPDVVDRLPDEYREAATALMSMGDLDLENGDVGELADRLLAPGVGGQLLSLADLAAACGNTETEQALRSYAAMVDLGSVGADDAYCALLVAELDPSNDGDDVPPELVAAAPAAHADALERISALAESEGVPAEDVLGLFGGLGLYAEAQCGGEGLFGTMLFIGAFAGAFAGDDGIISSSGIDPTTPPTPGDPAAATAALPTDAGFGFVVQTFAVEDDGEYVVSAIVPNGWESDDLDDPFFGVTFEPAGEGFGFFSEMTFRAGCDGLCEPTDWRARLEDDDGWLTQRRANEEFSVDEAYGDGWLLVGEGFSGGVEGTVLRWNDGADRYLSCEFELDEDDVAYVDAFIAACGSATPGWFPS